MAQKKMKEMIMKIKVLKDISSQKAVVNFDPELFLELKHSKDEALEIFSPRTKKSIVIAEYVLNRKANDQPNSIQMHPAYRKKLQIELNELVEIQKLKINPNPIKLVIIAGVDKIPSIRYPEELLIELEGLILTKNEINNPIIRSRISDSKLMVLEFSPPYTACRIQYSTKITLLEFPFEDIILDDEKFIEILKDLSGRATTMKLVMVKNILKMKGDTFLTKIFDWEKKLGYKIKGDSIYFQVEGMSEIFENLEELFIDWKTNKKKLERPNEVSTFNEKLDYNSLSFINLRILMEKGDYHATGAFKSELIRRIKSNWPPSILFLIKKGYFKYFDDSELKLILFDHNFNLLPSMKDALCNKSTSDYRFLAYLRKLCELKDNSAWEIFFFTHLNVNVEDIYYNNRYDDITSNSIRYFYSLFKKTSFDINTFENYYNIYNRIADISDIDGILNKISKPFIDENGHRDYYEVFNYNKDLTSEEYHKAIQILLLDSDLSRRCTNIATKKFYKVFDFPLHELLKTAEKLKLNKNYGELIDTYNRITRLIENFTDRYSNGIKRMIEINKWIIYNETKLK